MKKLLSYLFPRTFKSEPSSYQVEPSFVPNPPKLIPVVTNSEVCPRKGRKYRASDDAPYYLGSGNVKAEYIVAAILNEKIGSDYRKFLDPTHPGTDLLDLAKNCVEIQVKRRQWTEGYKGSRKCLRDCFQNMLDQDPEAVFALCETAKGSSKLLRVTLCKCFEIYKNLHSTASKTGVRTVITHTFMLRCGGIEVWNHKDHSEEAEDSHTHSYLLRTNYLSQ